MSTKISALPTATSVATTDAFPVVQGGTTKRVPASALTLGAWGTVTLEQFGAIGDGVTDDTAAYISAVASGKTILLGARTYLVNGTAGWAIASITTPGQGIIGVGDQSVLKTTSNYAVVDASSGAGLNVFKNFRILGNSTGAAQHGITTGHDSAGTGQSRIEIEGVTCEALGGRGFSLEYTSISFLGPRLTNCLAFGCLGYGFYFAVSDYVTCTNCVAMNCGPGGVYSATGNLMWTGGAITANTSGSGYGILWDVSGNDGHSQIVGCEINHNTIAIKVNAIVNGLSFVGCNVYYGTIDCSLTTASPVVFKQCFVDVTSVTGASSGVGTVRFDDCVWPMANANTFAGQVSANPGNVKIDGTGFDLSDVGLDAGAAKKIAFRFNGATYAYVDPTHGRLYTGQKSTDCPAILGPLPGNETTLSSLHLLANGGTPTASNPVAWSDGSSLNLSSPLNAGHMRLYTGSTTLLVDALNTGWSFKVPLATARQDIALVNGANNNVAITGSFLRITGPSAAFSITGFASGIDGMELRIFNTTAFAMTIANASGSSSAGNKITTLTGADVVLAARTTAAHFIYDGSSTTWILMGTS